MVPEHTPIVPAPEQTCQVMALERTDIGFRFRVEFGIGPDYLGTMSVVLDEYGKEVEHETHRVEPSVEFGWPSFELRETVLSRCREMIVIYIAGSSENIGRSRRRDSDRVNFSDWQPKHRRRFW